MADKNLYLLLCFGFWSNANNEQLWYEINDTNHDVDNGVNLSIFLKILTFGHMIGCDMKVIVMRKSCATEVFLCFTVFSKQRFFSNGICLKLLYVYVYVIT